MHTRIFIVAGLLMAAGCESGVPSGTLLGAVTDQQARDLCDELSPGIPTPTFEQSCSLNALLAATTTSQAECESARDLCLAGTPPDTTTDCASTDSSEFDGCPADSTVGDFRNCLSATNTLLSDLYSRADCANFGTASAPTLAELSEVPPACAPIDGCGSP